MTFALLLSGLAMAAPASAEETVCRGTLTGRSLDNVKVPSGATCRLVGGSLNGSIIAQNLQCKENVPAPTGRGNSAGSKEDQCARL